MGGRKRRSSGQARRTKIVCTIGPATFSRRMVERLARAGMDVARLNFSHGDQGQHGKTISTIRAVEKKLGRPLGVLQDLAGPKLRVGELPEEGVELKARGEVVLSTASRPKPGQIPLPLPEAAEALEGGQRVLLGDGRIELRVLDRSGSEVRCRVKVGGVLRSHQGVHLPDVELPIETVTKKDLADLRFGLERGVDWVAMSFVRTAKDLEPLRREIGRSGKSVRVMAKIEQHEAIDHLEEIIEAADGVMVARGDLGIELPLDRVPLLQKSIIQCCNAVGKPVVTATQMLESMIDNPRPTRAEVSDIANAVLDGTDAVMLSGETAIGRYPVEAVKVMARVAARGEAAFDFEERLAESSQWPCETVTDGISQATVSLANDLQARAIITATASGHTAFMVAMHRPETPIIAVTPDVATQRRLTLAWGVRALLAKRGKSTDELILHAIGRAREEGLVAEEDVVVVTAGVPAGVPGLTNLIKVEVVGRYHRF
ncbi:MAG TPA: pyruvate kinase [Armatimonadota bacterium]|nr:pyruvate kinase [Armatimonadota bacterium]